MQDRQYKLQYDTANITCCNRGRSSAERSNAITALRWIAEQSKTTNLKPVNATILENLRCKAQSDLLVEYQTTYTTVC